MSLPHTFELALQSPGSAPSQVGAEVGLAAGPHGIVQHVHSLCQAPLVDLRDGHPHLQCLLERVRDHVSLCRVCQGSRLSQ